MTLQTAGPISLDDVATEFNTNPDLESCAFAAGLVLNEITLNGFYGLTNVENPLPTTIGDFFNPSGLAQDKSFPAVMSGDGRYIFSTMNNSNDGGIEVFQNNNGYITFLDRYEGTTGSYLGGRYNASIDVSNDGYTVIVGAPFEGADGTVKVLQFDGTNLNLVATVDDSSTDTEYGSSVQISRDGFITYITSQENLYIGIYDAFDDSTFNVSSFPLPNSDTATGRQLRVEKGAGEWAYVASPNADSPTSNEGEAYLLDIDTDNLTASLSDTMSAPTPTVDGNFGSSFTSSNDSVWFITAHNGVFLLYKRVGSTMNFIAEVAYNTVTEVGVPSSAVISLDGNYICVTEEGVTGDPDNGYQIYILENRNGSFVQRSSTFIPAPDGIAEPVVFSSDSKFLLVPNSKRDGENPTRIDMGGGTALLTNLDLIKTSVLQETQFDANPQVAGSNYGDGGAYMSSNGSYFGVTAFNSGPSASVEFFKHNNNIIASLGKFVTNTTGTPVMDDLGEYWVTSGGGGLNLFRREIDPDLPEVITEIQSGYTYTGASGNFGFNTPFMTRDSRWILTGDDTNNGTGYLVENVGGVLTDVASFQPNDISVGDSFGKGFELGGFEMSQDGQWIVGCSSGADSNTGALYLFQHVNGTITQTSKVVPSSAVAGDEVGEYGAAISADGGWVVVGSQKTNGVRGSGWLYKRVGDQLIEQDIFTRLLEFDSTQGFFGGRPSITDDGTRIFVPQYNFSNVGLNGGMVLVYENTVGSLTFDTFIQPSLAESGRFFSRNRIGISSDGKYLVGTQLSDEVVSNGGLGWLLNLGEELPPSGDTLFAITPDYTKTANDFMVDGTGATLDWKFLQDRILVTDEFFTNLNARRNKITGSFVYDGAGADLTILTRPSGPTYTILAANLTGDPTVTLELDVIADTFVVTVTPPNGSPQVEINTTASDNVFSHMGSNTATMGIKFNEAGTQFAGSNSKVTFSGDIVT